MQDFYQMPFEPFERYSPYGTPEDVAEFLSPYIEAGCSAFNVIPCASDQETAVSAVGELRQLLTNARDEPPPNPHNNSRMTATATGHKTDRMTTQVGPKPALGSAADATPPTGRTSR